MLSNAITVKHSMQKGNSYINKWESGSANNYLYNKNNMIKNKNNNNK